MADHQPLGSNNPQTSSIGGDKGHNPRVVDEHDSDADTISMDSTEFWNGANVENSPVVQNRLILRESTRNSTYEIYPGCRIFDCTHLLQHPEMTCDQLVKRKIETNGVESGSNRSHQFCRIDSEPMEDALISYGNFKSLSDSEQKEYFNRMGRICHDRKGFETSCPRIDRMVLKHYDAGYRLTAAEREAAYSLQELIERKWRLSNTPLLEPKARHAHRNTNKTTCWHDNNLRWNSVDSRFELEQTQSAQPSYQSLDDFERSIRQHGFYKHISSALLLYRLNILAGGLKEVESDLYKTSWDMTFHHLDEASILRMWDSKGRAKAKFSGLKEAEGDALELINFVTRFKFPHTYDGVISGTAA